MTYVRRRPKHLIVQDRLHYHCELDTCPACGIRLVSCRHYRWAKTVQQDVSAWQQAVQQHLRAVSERYWRGILVCYDQVGVPRTNNDLEGRFGQVRRQARRQSGFGQLRRPLVRHSAWLIYQADDADMTALQARLAQVPQAV